MKNLHMSQEVIGQSEELTRRYVSLEAMRREIHALIEQRLEKYCRGAYAFTKLPFPVPPVEKLLRDMHWIDKKHPQRRHALAHSRLKKMANQHILELSKDSSS